MLNLILGKPKLDFYLEIALAHLSQLEFKVCKIAPQAGFLRFWQAKYDDFSLPKSADGRHNHHSGTPQSSSQTTLKIIQVDTGECKSESKVFPSHSLATDKIIQVQPRSLLPPNTQPAAPLICII